MKIHRLLMIVAALAVFHSCGGSGEGFSTTVFEKGENGVYGYRIPALVQAKDGSIVAFAEARNESLSDTGDIAMVAKRSTDGGRTWSDPIPIWADAGNTCGNPTPVVDRNTGRIVLVVCWNNGKDSNPIIRAGNSIDPKRVYVFHSEDNGLSWSEPKEITSAAMLEDWTSYATGPCHGIQLQAGPHKGRLVIPCNHGVPGEFTESNVIYSDDGGDTWRLGCTVGDGNECTIAELPNGDLLLNMRGKSVEVDGSRRLVAWSHDGGETFEGLRYEEGLIEPVCNASIVNYTKKGKLTETLLFSNPDSEKERIRMTIKRSDDGGQSWRTACKLSDKPAAYSDLLVLSNGDVAVLYETGEKNCYERIDFAVVPAKCLK